MPNLEHKADEMVRSPLGCAFLLAAAASGLPPEEIAAPHNCIFFAAYAASDTWVWMGGRQEQIAEILRQGQQHRGLALSVLDQPAAASWFEPLDTRKQVYVPWQKSNGPPDPDRFVPPTYPLSRRSRYGQSPDSPFPTSTMVAGTSGQLVGMDEHLDDMYLAQGEEPPWECWLLEADPSARVFEIDGPKAWHELCVRYPAEAVTDPNRPDFSGDYGQLIPDWPAVAADWDAAHLSFGGLLTASHVRVESGAGWTYLWDWMVEMTHWLSWKFTHIERMPDHEPVKSPLEELFLPRFYMRKSFGRRQRSRTYSPSVTDFYKVPVDFPDLQPAPEQPPDVYLVAREADCSERQRAIHVHSDWRTANGETVTNPVDLPIDRPSALEVPESGTVAIRFATPSAPTLLKASQYGDIKPDGLVLGEPLITTVWEHPKVYSYRAEEHARTLTYITDDDVPGWELEIQLSPSADVSYIMLFANWHDRGRGVCSANWTMSARRSTPRTPKSQD